MSKRYLVSFLIGDLKIVRVICRKNECGGVIEVPVDKLAGATLFECPICRQVIHPHNTNPLIPLGKAINDLSNEAFRKEFDVEFVLPDTTGEVPVKKTA
jgi:hypothetical protein